MNEMSPLDIPSALGHYRIEAKPGQAGDIEFRMTIQEFEWIGDVPTPSSRQEIVVRLSYDQAIRLGNALMVIAG